MLLKNANRYNNEFESKIEHLGGSDDMAEKQEVKRQERMESKEDINEY